MSPRRVDRAAFRQEVEAELTRNILPFWMNHVVDEQNGGFYGAVTNDLEVRNDVPRSAILCARILWTYSAAYRRLGGKQYLSMADRARDYLTRVLWDHEYGGLYWEVDCRGNPVSDRKHHYAQAFGVYGLAEYYRATGEPESLTLARRLFDLLEEHGYEPVHGGYIEGSSRDWGHLADARLSHRDLNCRKSMNTLLHILEGYTNLLRVVDDAKLKAQHRRLLETFLEHVLDPRTGHLNLFFGDDWHSLSGDVSFGHDIECSWLLCEAADVQGDPVLRARVREVATDMAAAVRREGIDRGDGSLLSGRTAQGLVDAARAWWPQAEAVVGFYNAYQISGQEEFARAARRCWNYIQAKVVDRVHGDWFKELGPDGTPNGASYKAGPWHCPYHQSRACFELLARLNDP